MQNLSPISLIQAKFTNMTSGEKKISQFIIEHYDEITYYNIADIAREVEVSESSIVRYTKMLGFTGFRDFKFACAKGNSEQFKGHYQEFKGDSDSFTSVLTHYFNSHITNVSNNLQQLDMNVLEYVANTIAEGNSIYVAGVYLSGSLALSFYHRLRLLYKDVFFIDNSVAAEMSHQWVRPGDVVVAITQSGETEDVIYFVDKAKKRGGKIIGITATMNSSLDKLANITILPVSNFKNNEAKYINNESIIKLLLDSLYIYLLIQREHEASDSGGESDFSNFWFR